MNIGKAIKILRKKSKLTQIELAERCRISQTSLSQIENGLKKPRATTMTRICKVLNVPQSVVYILALEDTDVPPERRFVYDLLFPSITALALQIVGSHYDIKHQHIGKNEILTGLQEPEILN